MTQATVLGNLGESYALELLQAHGYKANLLRTNNPTYDIEVVAPHSFLVSVKTANEKQHVRLGSENSVNRLAPGNFVFAFMPVVGSKQILLQPNGYRLLIIPAEIAKSDASYLLSTYIEEKGLVKSYSLIAKGYSKREPQKEVWSRWAVYENAWHLLPV